MTKEGSVVCIGQALVDCITRGAVPDKKNVYRAQKISLNLGGDALNEASVLAKNGVHVKMACGIGRDVAGGLVRKTAKERGIDVSLIREIDDLVTPVANLMVDMDGSRISYNSPATMLEGYYPENEVVKGAKIVSFASLFRAPLDRKDVIIRLVKAAKEEGAVICADTKIPTYRPIRLEDIKEILPLIDYIFPNENEAAYHTGRTDFMEAARVIREMGVKNVIIKTGPKGCTVCGPDESFELPAMDVKAVDTTGAGDNFVAGFICGLLENLSLKECARKGTAFAAQCVLHAGAFQ